MNYLTIVNGARRLINAIVTSAGAGDANKIIATNAQGKLDSTFLPAGIGPDTTSIITSEALTDGNFVNIFNNAGTRTARKADASNGRAANGFVLANFGSAAMATVYLQGENTSMTGQTPGGRVYLSATTPGLGTNTAPTLTSGQIYQELGYSTSTTSALFEYDGWIEIA